MKVGIVGPPQAGKTSVLTVLTQEPLDPDAQAGRSLTRVVRVPDGRLDHLFEVYAPRSLKPATFLVTDFGAAVSQEQRIGEERGADALLAVLPAFGGADPARALAELEGDWTLLDVQSAEQRKERIEARVRRPIPPKEREQLLQELALMERVLAWVTEERPLRDMPLEPKELKVLRPFGFFTLKPRLLVANVGEDDLPYAEAEARVPIGGAIAVSARLEAELAVMAPEERAAFQEEFEIAALARERLTRAAYRLLGLHAFFTVGDDEVRAWTIPVGATAWEAAGQVHTDMQRGFIRAEVLAYDDFVASGSDEKRAKAAHRVRLEGRDYVVQDGDMVEFRFNV